MRMSLTLIRTSLVNLSQETLAAKKKVEFCRNNNIQNGRKSEISATYLIHTPSAILDTGVACA